MRPGCAIREGRYKLIRWYEPEVLEGTMQAELYDLESDPGEQHDLADSLPQQASILMKKLDQWIVEVGAQLPGPNK